MGCPYSPKITEELESSLTDTPESEIPDEVLNETLLHKWASSEEIAEWVYFITVINKSMTGEDILIDNGEMLKSNFIW